ncbi:retrovirus-related Pol polyprotein from transposon 297 [Trichonephila clavipes]|nr:retrovirus-related Pol polyprotein from transposon 297 [Trichonephila clavipes]
MRSFAGDNVGEPLLKSLWLGRLPNGTQTILAALNENLDQLATVADKINDLIFSQGINSVAATSEKKTAPLEQQIAQLTQQVLKQYPELYNPSQPIYADTSNQVYHHIETKGPPVFSKPCLLAPTILKAVKKEFKYLIKQGIIRPSKSPCASPLHVVKKSNGEYRPCGDYRRLNSVTVPDRCPVPHIQDCTQNLYGKTIITTLNLARAYHQIAINPADIPKTSVTTPFGLFEYTAMPFGLRNSGQTFQRHMHQVLGHLEFCIPYFDDLLIASSSENEHLDYLHQIFSRLRDYGLKLNTDKCVLGKTSVKFLGCLITAESVKPFPDKVEAIANFPKPDTISQLRHFLTMLNFHTRFLPHAANGEAPLNKLFTNSDSQTKDEELKTLISSNDLSIKLKLFKMGNALEIFCDVSREKVRPYVPEELRFEVFRSLHNLSHKGIRATKRLIQDRFVWPSILKDIAKWT